MFTIISLFIVAQVLLGIVVWIGLAVAAREPRLAGRLAAIIELMHRPTRIEAARKEETRTRSDIEAIDKRLGRARQRLADLISMPESPASAVGFAILAFILYEGEAAVALLLNLANTTGKRGRWRSLTVWSWQSIFPAASQNRRLSG